MADQKKRGAGTSSRPSAQRKRRKTPLYAAVDMGTNNCRLLIAARRGDGFTVVDSHSQVVRLGEGLEASGRLSDAAIERAMDALRKIAAKLKAKRVGQVRCIATEACRRAVNGGDFIKRVREETGLTFKIIGAEEEARLAFVGCHSLVAPKTRQVLVIDIGGGSTELSLVDTQRLNDHGLASILPRPPMRAWISLPMGVVTLTEAFADITDEVERYDQMLASAMDHLRAWKQLKSVQKALLQDQSHIIGTSGTITCLTGVHLGLQKYRRDAVDGQWISVEDMAATIERLRVAGPAGRVRFPTIGQDRAPMMLAGCAIVEAVLSVAPNGRMRVADRGLREGLLLSMMKGPKRRRPRHRRPRKSNGPAVLAEKGHAKAEEVSP